MLRVNTGSACVFPSRLLPENLGNTMFICHDQTYKTSVVRRRYDVIYSWRNKYVDIMLLLVSDSVVRIRL